MSLRNIFTLMAVVVFGVPVAAAIIKQTQNLTATPTYEANDIYIVQPANAGNWVEAEGEIEVDKVLDLSFLAGGMVHAVYVNEGDTVEAGDILAVLENETQRVAVEQARVALNISQLQRDDLVEVDEDEIALAEARIEAAANNYGYINNQIRNEDIQAAELGAGAAEDSVQAAYEARMRAGGVPEEAIRLLEAEIGEATFNAEIARLEAENLRDLNAPNLGAAAANIDRARAELERVLAGPSEYDVTAANLSVNAAENALAQAQTAFERTVLVAPENGVITNITIEDGQRIAPGQPVMRLIDGEPLHAVLEVDEIDIRELEIGMDAKVVLDAMPGGSFDATLTRIAQDGIERAGVVVYEAEAELNNPDERIRPGMSTTTYVITQPTDTRPVVPSSYIGTDADSDYVLRVRDDGTIETVHVTLGDTTNNGIEITSGATTDDALVPPAETE